MYEEVTEFCHQWNTSDQDSFTPPAASRSPHLLLSGAMRNLAGSLEVEATGGGNGNLADYLPPLTMEELTSSGLHSPETDSLLYPEDDQPPAVLDVLSSVPEATWTDCLQLTSDLPDWMEMETLTALQFPSIFSLG
jgi:hypothetical protein